MELEDKARRYDKAFRLLTAIHGFLTIRSWSAHELQRFRANSGLDLPDRIGVAEAILHFLEGGE